MAPFGVPLENVPIHGPLLNFKTPAKKLLHMVSACDHPSVAKPQNLV